MAIKDANSKAVSAANCLGERFFPLNIIGISPWINLKTLRRSYPFIANNRTCNQRL